MPRCAPRRRRPRAGLSTLGLSAAVAGVLVAGALAYYLLPRRTAGVAGPLVHVVQRGTFLHEITERGNVESVNPVEVRCEVQSLNSAGTRILWIIPEGSRVEKGQEICRLDSSSLENDKTKQQIVRSNSEAAAIQARNDLETAKIAKKEYLEGKYIQEEQLLQSEVFVAEENYRRAEEYLRYSEELAEEGFLPPLQLEAEKFAKEKQKLARESAQTKLDVLHRHTKAKMELQLQSDIDTAKAKLDAAEHTLKLDDEKLKLIEQQIKNCRIAAPAAGQVVYASQTERMGGQETIIEEGASVRERQVIVRLPDPKQMQIKAKINESKVALVVKGQPTAIRVQAFAEHELKGEVKEVSEYPAAGAWYAANIKEYDTLITIRESPVPLRPGLSAEVKIRVAELGDVLQAPVQAVVEHGERHYCAVRTPEGWEARVVDIGATNDQFVVIRSGLEEGEAVAVNASACRDDLDLPELPRSKVDAKGDEKDGAAGRPPASEGLRPAEGDGAPGKGEFKGPPGKGGPGRGGPRKKGPPGDGPPKSADKAPAP